MQKIQQATKSLWDYLRVPVCYLGRKISYLPGSQSLGNDIEKNPFLALVGMIAALVLSLIFSSAAFSLAVMIGSYYVGLSAEDRCEHQIKEFCFWVDQTYSPLLVFVSACALVYASQYIISSSCVNGVVGFIRGLGLGGRGDFGNAIFYM